MAAYFTVANGVALLSATHAKDMTKIHETKRHRDSVNQSLKEYLEFVRDEPLEWMRTLPPTWMSESYFARAKTAICTLCKRPEVIAAMGEEGAAELPDEVRREIKAQLLSTVIAQEIQSRCGRFTAVETGEDAEEDPEEDPEEDAEDARYVRTLRLRNACVAAAGSTVMGDVFRSMWESDNGLLDAGNHEAPEVLVDAVADLLRNSPDYSRIFARLFY